MYRELIRFFAYKRRYGFDTICECIYSVIFLCGLGLVVNITTWEQAYYFFLYYIMTNSILMANEELEYEIRSDQYSNLTVWKKSSIAVYFMRFFAYFCWSSALFLFSLFLLTFPNFIQGEFSASGFGILVATITHLFITMLLYYFMLIATVRFQRISVLLYLMNTIILFSSGMVFPSQFSVSYQSFLKFLIDCF